MSQTALQGMQAQAQELEYSPRSTLSIDSLDVSSWAPRDSRLPVILLLRLHFSTGDLFSDVYDGASVGFRAFLLARGC